MSYDITLYDKGFLKRALAEGLGDWTNADPIPQQSLIGIRTRLLTKGYRPEADTADCQEYSHARSEWGLQVSVFPNQVAFAISYGKDADAAIDAALADAKELAQETDLAVYDLQEGEVVT